MSGLVSIISRTGTRSRRIAFIVSILLVPIVMAACGDSGGPGGSDVARGQQVYQRYCNVCHPGGNAGAGPAITVLAPRLSDDQIKAAIRQGKNRMPPYNERDIPEADLASLVSYIRTIK